MLRTALTCGALHLTACGQCGTDAGGRAAAESAPAGSTEPIAKAARRQAAAPAGLLGSLVIRRPSRVWQDVRSSEQRFGSWPGQFPLIISRALGASPLLSGRFMPAKPVVAALALPEEIDSGTPEEAGRALEWAVGFRVRSGAELVAELSSGHAAPFQARRQGRTVLLNGERDVAVANNHLIFGSSDAALVRLSGYVSSLGASARSLSADGVTFELASGAGAALARRLAAAAPVGPRLTRAGGGKGGRSSGEPTPLATLWAQALGFLKTVSGGRFESKLSQGRLMLEGQLNAKLPFTVRADICDLVPQIPARAGAFVALGDVIGKVPQATAAASLGLDQKISAALSNARGPWLFGVDSGGELSLFASHIYKGDAAAQSLFAKTLVASPSVQGWFPKFLKGARLYRSAPVGSVQGGQLIASGEATARGQLAWSLRDSRAWMALSPSSMKWLAEHLSEVDRVIDTPRPSGRRCRRSTFLRARFPGALGEVHLDALESNSGAALRADLPLSSLLELLEDAP